MHIRAHITYTFAHCASFDETVFKTHQRFGEVFSSGFTRFTPKILLRKMGIVPALGRHSIRKRYFSTVEWESKLRRTVHAR